MTGNNEKNKGVNPLTCCQSNDSLTSQSTNNDVNICEALNNFVISPTVKISAFTQSSFRKQSEAHFPKRPPIDVKFENLIFTATSWQVIPTFKYERKEILHNVSGEFKSGELSAIMGPSGAGKSTLLNILAGYVLRGSGGTVKFNDDIRDGRPKFRKLMAYIPQEEEIRLGLTVSEAMTTVANLKLGYTVSEEYKRNQINEILELLGMSDHINVLAGKLSGGQRKRLAIAQELISNPPILFLDEPTTGLDSLSCTQCVQLLKRLAEEGRTVICTIHQPSALIFEMFDKLYALSDGRCIYNGRIPDLVPYLGNAGLECPPYHNPADFLMEVSLGEHGSISKLFQESKNHALISSEKETKLVKNGTTRKCSVLEDINCDSTLPPANSIMQFLILYKRNVLSARRNYSIVLNRILAHWVIAVIFGYLYVNVGNSANIRDVLANYVYLYGTVLLAVYTGKMSVTLSFPLEMKILEREHFNRWYRLIPYLLSVVLLEIPFQIFCTFTYILISYYLTGQPPDRILYFSFFCIIASLCAQAFGYFLGATTPIKVAVFVGPVLACVLSVFGFCIRYSDTAPVYRWMYHISYFRAGFHGLLYSVYYGRELPCTEIYCHYKEPQKFLEEMEIIDVNLWANASVILATCGCVHIATYLALWLKLNKR